MIFSGSRPTKQQNLMKRLRNKLNNRSQSVVDRMNTRLKKRMMNNLSGSTVQDYSLNLSIPKHGKSYNDKGNSEASPPTGHAVYFNKMKKKIISSKKSSASIEMLQLSSKLRLKHKNRRKKIGGGFLIARNRAQGKTELLRVKPDREVERNGKKLRSEILSREGFSSSEREGEGRDDSSSMNRSNFETLSKDFEYKKRRLLKVKDISEEKGSSVANIGIENGEFDQLESLIRLKNDRSKSRNGDRGRGITRGNLNSQSIDNLSIKKQRQEYLKQQEQLEVAGRSGDGESPNYYMNSRLFRTDQDDDNIDASGHEEEDKDIMMVQRQQQEGKEQSRKKKKKKYNQWRRKKEFNKYGGGGDKQRVQREDSFLRNQFHSSRDLESKRFSALSFGKGVEYSADLNAHHSNSLHHLENSQNSHFVHHNSHQYWYKSEQEKNGLTKRGLQMLNDIQDRVEKAISHTRSRDSLAQHAGGFSSNFNRRSPSRQQSQISISQIAIKNVEDQLQLLNQKVDDVFKELRGGRKEGSNSRLEEKNGRLCEEPDNRSRDGDGIKSGIQEGMSPIDIKTSDYSSKISAKNMKKELKNDKFIKFQKQNQRKRRIVHNKKGQGMPTPLHNSSQYIENNSPSLNFSLQKESTNKQKNEIFKQKLENFQDHQQQSSISRQTYIVRKDLSKNFVSEIKLSPSSKYDYQQQQQQYKQQQYQQSMTTSQNLEDYSQSNNSSLEKIRRWKHGLEIDKNDKNSQENKQEYQQPGNQIEEVTYPQNYEYLSYSKDLASENVKLGLSLHSEIPNYNPSLIQSPSLLNKAPPQYRHTDSRIEGLHVPSGRLSSGPKTQKRFGTASTKYIIRSEPLSNEFRNHFSAGELDLFQGDSSSTWNLKFVSNTRMPILVRDTVVYVGEQKKGLACGQGKLIVKATKKALYRGTFYDNLYHGEGLLFNPSASQTPIPSDWYKDLSKLEHWTTFQGTFMSGLPEGQGKLHLPNGSYLEGNFTRGRANGEGRVVEFYGKEKGFCWEDDLLICQQIKRANQNYFKLNPYINRWRNLIQNKRLFQWLRILLKTLIKPSQLL